MGRLYEHEQQPSHHGGYGCRADDPWAAVTSCPHLLDGNLSARRALVFTTRRIGLRTPAHASGRRVASGFQLRRVEGPGGHQTLPFDLHSLLRGGRTGIAECNVAE
jgi:hypothetical protein